MEQRGKYGWEGLDRKNGGGVAQMTKLRINLKKFVL